MSDATQQTEPEEKEHEYELRLRKTASWIALVGTTSLAVCFSSFLIYQTFNPEENPAENWLIEQMDEHFAATLGIPLSAITAACLVFLLKSTTGPIEFEFMGFKFRGASGPIVLWVVCFLAMIFGLWLLWDKG